MPPSAFLRHTHLAPVALALFFGFPFATPIQLRRNCP
jgi:hypothetical protein